MENSAIKIPPTLFLTDHFLLERVDTTFKQYCMLITLIEFSGWIMHSDEIVCYNRIYMGNAH